jgi:hypothetical protein
MGHPAVSEQAGSQNRGKWISGPVELQDIPIQDLMDMKALRLTAPNQAR